MMTLQQALMPDQIWPHVGIRWPAFDRAQDQAHRLVSFISPIASENSILKDVLNGNLTFNGDPQWSSDSTVGPVVIYDGADDYAQVVGYKGIVGTAARTTVQWFKTTDARGANYNFSLSWGPTSGSGGVGWNQSVESGVIWLRTWSGRVASYGSGYNNGAMHQVIMSFPAGGDLSNVDVYVDGKFVAGSVSSDGSINTTSSQDIRIGVRADGIRNFIGSIGDTLIYEREFSAKDAYNQYNNPWQLYRHDSSIARYWTSVGAITVPLNALTLAGSAEALTVAPGPVAVLANALTLAGSAETLTVLPGAMALAMNALTLIGSAESLTVVPGAVSPAMDALTLAGSAESLTVVPGAIQLAMGALTLAGAAESLAVTPGAVQMAMDALTLASSAGTLTVSNITAIAMAALVLAGTTPGLTVVPGAVTILLDALTALASTPGITVQTVGRLFVALSDALTDGVGLADALVSLAGLSDEETAGVELDDS